MHSVEFTHHLYHVTFYFIVAHTHVQTENYIQSHRVFSQYKPLGLALVLVNELLSASSPWKPYIDILPRTLNLPILFSIDDFIQMQGTPIKQLLQKRYIDNIIDYVLVLEELKKEGSSFFPLELLTFQVFSWAMATVHSRQNPIPSQTQPRTTDMAFIPILDLFNHRQYTHDSSGITSMFNETGTTCEIYAPIDIKAGDQIHLQYGTRSNDLLFAYSGFVYDDDRLDVINLGLMLEPKMDNFRKQLLMKIGFDDPKPVDLDARYHLSRQTLDDENSMLLIACLIIANEPKDSLDFFKTLIKDKQTSPLTVHSFPTNMQKVGYEMLLAILLEVHKELKGRLSVAMPKDKRPHLYERRKVIQQYKMRQERLVGDLVVAIRSKMA